MPRFPSLLPKSLVARVFTLYLATLLLFVGLGLGIFYRYQFRQHVEEAQDAATMLVEVVAQTVADSAVIGDYDTIKRTLERSIRRPQFSSAAFIELNGAVIKVENRAEVSPPPRWLRDQIAAGLYDINHPIGVGGRDYGVLRLQFDPDAIGASLWRLIIYAWGLGFASLVGGLVLIRFPLKQWLGSLEKVQTFERDLKAGVIDPGKVLSGDVPEELRSTFDVLMRTAESLRLQLSARENALKSLRGVLKGLMPESEVSSRKESDPSDDIEVLSAMVEQLVNERESGRRALTNQKFALDQHAIVTITDRHGRINYANDKFCEVSGYTREELIGKTHQVVRSDANPPELFTELWSTILSGQVWRGEICNRAKNGTLHWLAATIVPLVGPDGKPEEYIAIRIDISRRKEAEAALMQARDTAESANRAKSDFLANMSHEIRTPMNGIIGMTELALDTPDPEEQRQYMRTVQSSADSLLAILNDILDFSKIEAGKLAMEQIPFSIRSSMGDTLKGLAARAHEKGLELIADISPDLPETLIGDPGRLRQIAVNLVGNAIKFTEKGEIVLRITTPKAAGDTVPVRIEVIDTGIGIPHDKQAAVFESFTQEDSSTTRRYGGTGLGLAISNRLVNMMGGRIHLASEPGQGSNFSFEVTFGVGTPPADLPAPSPALTGKKMLVVDDHPVNRAVLSNMLARWNVAVREAPSGAIALKLHAADPADIVLLDARMPFMDGFETARQLLSGPAAPRVALLSSVGVPGDAARCRDLGIAAYLPKPVSRDELLAMLHRMLGLQPAQTQTLVTRHDLREQQKPLDILLVEDHPVNRLLALRLLERWGHRTTVAEDGRQGLDRLRERRFDVVLMDLQMPVMGGLEATRIWREEEKGGRTPIIAMTASAMVSDREACMAAGMDDYIAKPLDQAALKNLLKSIGEAGSRRYA